MSEKKLFGEIFKNPLEKIKISLNEFKEVEYLDLRVWYSPTDGQGDDFKPSQRGITVKLEDLKEFKNIVDKACKELVKL